jgi:hypothetical protein
MCIGIVSYQVFKALLDLRIPGCEARDPVGTYSGFGEKHLYLSSINAILPSALYSSRPENLFLFVMATITIIIILGKELTFKSHASYIQGVPGGKDLTSGECSLGQTILI